MILVFTVKIGRTAFGELFELDPILRLARVTRERRISYVKSLLFRAHDLLESGVVQHRILSPSAIGWANNFRHSLGDCSLSSNT